MRELGPDIWLFESPGIPTINSRVVVRLSSGGLWVHSPPMLNPGLKSELETLGSVEAIVAPNNVHTNFVSAWREAYPDAGCYVARGVPAKLLDLKRFDLIEDVAIDRWSDEFDTAIMRGVPLFDECVFLHKASRSLIVTDMIQHYPPHTQLIGKLLFGPLGWHGICPAPPLQFDFAVHDRSALMDFLDTVRAWDFDRIVVTHGACIENNPKAIFDSIHARIRNQRGSAFRGIFIRLMLSLLLDGGIPKKTH